MLLKTIFSEASRQALTMTVIAALLAITTSMKHGSDYLYPTTKNVLGSLKHYNLSSKTLNERIHRANSPLVSRELDR